MIAALRKTDWFFRFMAGYTALHLAWLVVLVYDFFARPLAPDPITGSLAYRWFTVFGITPLALVVSYMVLRHTPGNVTGLCLLLWAVLNLGQAVPPSSPFYIYNGIFNTGWTGLWLLALYFPNGRAYPLRFERWIRLLSVAAVLLIATWNFFQPTVNNYNTSNPDEVIVKNPLFIPALLPFKPLVDVLEMASLISIVVLIVPSLALRYRASSTKERLQVKWLAWTYGLLVASLPFIIPSQLMNGNPYRYGVPGMVVVVVFSLYVSLAPYLSVGVAILRHRLYDIDILIRKTLVWGAITVLLGLVYFGGVTLLQAVFSALSRNLNFVQAQSPIIIVLSTLAIAALFNPLRKRVQEFVDRRFYRRKYNAEQALESFAALARQEVNLEEISARLLGVVEETVQPESASLWLKPAASGTGTKLEIQPTAEGAKR